MRCLSKFDDDVDHEEHEECEHDQVEDVPIMAGQCDLLHPVHRVLQEAAGVLEVRRHAAEKGVLVLDLVAHVHGELFQREAG